MGIVEYPEESWGERMFLLQESIVFQFGFMRSMNPSEVDPNHHYVHCSGNMFVFIPTSSSQVLDLFYLMTND